MRSEKLIHIGSTKTMTITDLVLSSLIASIYAIGYAKRRQTVVVTKAIAKL